MEQAFAALSQMGVLILIVALGFLISKLGYLDRDFINRITKLLVDVFLPCMVIASVSDLDVDVVAQQLPWILALSCITWLVWLLVSGLVALVLGVQPSKRMLYMFMGTCINTGFIGMPLIASVLGAQTAILSSIFVTVTGIFVYAVGFTILGIDQQRRESLGLSGDGAEGSEGTSGGVGSSEAGLADSDSRRAAVALSNKPRVKFSIPWKSICNPAMIASIFALVILFTGFQLPGMVLTAADMVGSMTSPLSMLTVGFFISQMPVRELVSEWRLIPFSVLRQLGCAFLLYFALRGFVPDAMVLGVCVLMSCMPVGSMVPAFVMQFGGDEKTASKGTVVTTLLTFAYIPVMLALMG